MTSKEEMKQSIQSVIQTMMDRVMYNVLIRDPFLPEEHRARSLYMPFLFRMKSLRGHILSADLLHHLAEHGKSLPL